MSMSEEDYMRAQLENQRHQTGVGMMGMLPPSQPDASLAELRWNPDNLLHQLAKQFCGYEVKKDENGNDVMYRPEDAPPPLMNDRGLRAVIAFLYGRINTPASLTSIGDEDANEIAGQDWDDIDAMLAYNSHDYGIDTSTLQFISGQLNRLNLLQLKRAVNGFEANNFKTQAVEQKLQHTSQPSQGGGGFPFFGSRSKG